MLISYHAHVVTRRKPWKVYIWTTVTFNWTKGAWTRIRADYYFTKHSNRWIQTPHSYQLGYRWGPCILDDHEVHKTIYNRHNKYIIINWFIYTWLINNVSYLGVSTRSFHCSDEELGIFGRRALMGGYIWRNRLSIDSLTTTATREYATRWPNWWQLNYRHWFTIMQVSRQMSKVINKHDFKITMKTYWFDSDISKIQMIRKFYNAILQSDMQRIEIQISFCVMLG